MLSHHVVGVRVLARVAALTAIVAMAFPAPSPGAEEGERKEGVGALSSCTSPPSVTSPVVQDVYKFGRPKSTDPDRNLAGIRDLIVIKVLGLCVLMDQARCLGAYAHRSCKEQQIALYLEGRELQALTPESGAPRADVETLQFRLDRSAKSDAQWADLLGSPGIGQQFFERPVAVSVGLPSEGPIATKVQSFRLIRIRSWWFYICSFILVVAICAMGFLARYTGLLRWSDATSAYSLARCQMAFWFVMVIASFTFIWLITGAVDIITNTALVLIGIGAGTGVSRNND
jgi:hypothetical protein